MSLLSIALHQAQLGTWWNEPTMPWKSNQKKRAKSADRRVELLDILKRAKKPMFVSDLAAANDCTIQSIRSISRDLVDSGKLARIERDGKVMLEYLP